MTLSTVVRFGCAVVIVGCISAQATSVQAQQRGGTAETDKIEPVNSGANPYRVIRDWAQLTLEKRPWGGSNGVAIDRDGKSVWATDRCSPGIAPGCLGTKANPVHLFDETGKETRSFGGGMFVWPHGIHGRGMSSTRSEQQKNWRSRHCGRPAHETGDDLGRARWR